MVPLHASSGYPCSPGSLDSRGSPCSPGSLGSPGSPGSPDTYVSPGSPSTGSSDSPGPSLPDETVHGVTINQSNTQ